VEVLNSPKEGMTIDLKKSDIFSLGISIYEMITLESLPENGEEWHNLRNGKLDRMFNAKGYSSHLKSLVASMMLRDYESRPTAT